MKTIGLMACAALIGGAALTAPACAGSIGVEADGARANGHWGGELGAGYRLGIAGFDITPGAGAYVTSGDGTKVYGRVEAGYTIPLIARVGAGVRITGGHTRPYGTVSLPLIPKLHAKANAGPHYAAIGLTLGY